MKKKLFTGCSLAILAASALSSQAIAQEDGAEAARRLPSVVVESQRIEENIQDVPIAVTALDMKMLQERQVDTFADLQFTAPNVNYSKTFFSGNNFQIRGIGSTLTAASADSGVAAHFNDVYVQTPRLFETEYYDVERVELLRGPQGTLFGRNATGGTVNVVTAKPVLDEWQGAASFEYGNFNSQRLKGMVNVPLGDIAAVRLAGIYLKRDGFSETVDPRADFKDFDDRDIYSLRGSLRIQPTDSTTIDFIGSYFEEDDARTRTAKGLCDYDATAVLGCTPTGLGFDSPNFSATSGGLGMSDLILGPLGAFAFNTIQANPNPSDLRKVFMDTRPNYYADETFLMASLEHQFEKFTVNANISRQETMVTSNQWAGSPIGAGTVAPSPLIAMLIPNNYAAFFDGDLIGVSAIDPHTTGIIGGNIFRYADGIFSYDQSDIEAKQTSFEARVTSKFDGPLNFTLGYYNLDYENSADYYVVSNSLDYMAAVLPTALSMGAGGPPVDGFAMGVPYFFSNTDAFTLDSQGIFGEVYWQATDDLKFTLGLRSTTDEKFVRDRTAPLLGAGLIPVGPGAAAATDALLAGSYREASVKFDNELTGRFVVDWKPDVSFTDSTMLYASYSRGYKAGGFNPPVNPALIAGVPETFAPERLNAYEIGAKNTIGSLQANLSAFYYDYKGLQVGKIQARTSINENVDATIWGLESEFLWAPTDNLLLNLTGAYLSTEVKSFQSEDPRDPTAGQAGHILIKDAIAANNCLLTNADAALFQAITGLQLYDINGLQSPGLTLSCAAADLAPIIAAMQAFGNTGVGYAGGIAMDLSGNQLQNSPEFSFNVGAQYTFNLANGMNLVARTDYYWQDDMFASIFNSPTQDRIAAWDVWNAQVTLNSADERWYARAFVQNILDEDHITGHFTGDQSTGLATSVFMLDPRLYGIELGIRF